MRVFALALASAMALVMAGCSDNGETPVDPWPLNTTTGLRLSEFGPVPALPEWADNPATVEKKDLGRALFSDPRLSGSGKTVCGNCHFPTGAFQSGGPKDVPDRSYPGVEPILPRNTPSLLNVVYAPMMRWDGSHFTNLGEMMVLPFAEANMNLAPGHTPQEVDVVDVPGAQMGLHAKVTTEIPGYVPLFQTAFGQDITKLGPADVWQLAGKAMAVYVRIAVARDAEFDRWNAGENGAMSEAAIRGLSLFRGKSGCVACHSGPMFSDYGFHNIGTSPPGADGKRPDDGRYLVTGVEKDRGAFLTPSLRGASQTSPYLHDGSEVSISKVIARKLSPEIRKLDPNHDAVLDTLPEISAAEVDDLVQFVKALKGTDIPIEDLTVLPKLP